MSQDRFSSTLDLLKGFSVNLYVGEEIVKGKLMGVEEDHIILENENNYIFYYSLDKIQAITKNTKEFQSEEVSNQFLKTTSLKDLLDSLTHSWVSILCLNKQTFSGIVSEVDSDFVTLVSGEERILIKLSHVSNIVKGVIEENSSSSDSDSVSNSDTDSNSESDLNSDSDSNEEEQNETEVTYQEEEAENSSNETIDIVEEITAIEEEESIDLSNQLNIDNSAALVWSQSIKPKTVEKEESTNQQTKSSKSDRTTSSKEEKSKKSKRSSSTKDQKSSKSKSSSRKVVEEVKGTKESTKETKKETTKETTALKFSNTANIFGSVKENRETKKTVETSAANIQKAEEKRSNRFAGEPISHNSEGAFPFAGWPSRRNRANRF
ncbi:hypothetical protein [Bacillus sp. UNC438CL73TsuS30]|uniref:hypothetical protein n=1 Tax=Bacillus sp. UNC438CL73TsuS30 TaxID=1340434 RepID=UPI00047C773A|nr:hypothetical protein [Bacillus sp. UNC438CL73TsuS30]